MAWFSGRKRRDDFGPFGAGEFNLVARVEATPLDLIPKGKARDQLMQEARDGGPLVDIYRTSAPGYGENFRAKDGWAYVIERPIRFRHDTRWSAEEWRIWCDAGMMDGRCMLCGETPVTFALSDEFRTRDGGRVYICYACNDAHLGIHGYERHAILDPCPSCHQVGLQIAPELDFCANCWRTGRH